MSTESKRSASSDPSSKDQPAQKKQKTNTKEGKEVVPFKPDSYDVITPYMCIKNCAAAIELYKKAFNAKESVLMGDSNQVHHAELEIYGRKVMMSDPPQEEFPGVQVKTALELGGNPVSLNIYVEDPDAAVKSALDAGCTSKGSPSDAFNGTRSGGVTDPYGNKWTFVKQVKDLTPEVLQERFNELFTRTERSGTENKDLSKNDTPAKNFKPANVQTITPWLNVRGAKKAIEWYTKVFDAKQEWTLYCPASVCPDPAENVNHTLLDIANGGKVFVCQEVKQMNMLSPESLGGTATSIVVYVENVDETFERAVAAGATVIKKLEDQFYGDRSGSIQDPFGHRWTLQQHIEEVTPEMMEERMAAFGAPPSGLTVDGKENPNGSGDITMQDTYNLESLKMKPVTPDDPNYNQPADPLQMRYVRTVHASRSRVWQAWSTSSLLSRWFIAEGKMLNSELDFKVGGAWRFSFNMFGKYTPCVWKYLEIVPEEKMEFLDYFEDDNEPLKPKQVAGWPLQVKATVTFRIVSPNETQVEVLWTPGSSDTTEVMAGFGESRREMVKGWNLFFDKLELLLKGGQ